MPVNLTRPTLTLTRRGLVGAATLLGGAALAAGGGDGGGVNEGPPDLIELTGIVRDFRERTAEDGHPDFEHRPDAGFGQYCGNVSPFLGADRKPVYIGEGWKVTSQWEDDAGRPICYALYDPEQGDVSGERGVSSTGGITSAQSFRSWFNDTPGKNMSRELTLSFQRNAQGVYVFDDKEDAHYGELDGFFPVEDQLFGNPGGSPDRNFHFTFELHTEFQYNGNAEQVFKFIGDDDVWVFVDGRMVIDLGGVHSAREQYVDLSRLGLSHGEVYTLDFFFAERHRTQSNFRIETNLELTSVELPSITAAFD